MVQLEVEVMFIGIRTEPDLLDNNFCSFRFNLFLFLFQLIKKLFIVDDLANRRIGCRRDLNQIESKIICNV
jgi:hypothetical protein